MVVISGSQACWQAPWAPALPPPTRLSVADPVWKMGCQNPKGEGESEGNTGCGFAEDCKRRHQALGWHQGGRVWGRGIPRPWLPGPLSLKGFSETGCRLPSVPRATFPTAMVLVPTSLVSREGQPSCLGGRCLGVHLRKISGRVCKERGPITTV